MNYAFEGDDRPPSNWAHLPEIGWTVARLWRGFGHSGPRGPEDGPPAMVIPGFLAGDRTALPLRKVLAEAGWRTYGWALGLNRGAHDNTLRHLRQRLEAIWDGRPVLLVGWSLGGVYARELAREVPERVRAVVTLGAPFSGDPHMNNVWRLYELVAGHKVEEPPIMHYSDKPPVPTLAIWSRCDGIIAPRAARGLDDERDKAVELGCRHMAFGMSRRVASDVAHAIEAFLGKPC